MSAKKKIDSKTFAKQKRNRRKLLTFVRMCRYGINSFSRNAWLTVAATAVMTITLLIIFATFSANKVLTDTVSELRSKVDMSIYLKTETTQEQGEQIKDGLLKLASVESVTYSSAEDLRERQIQDNKNDNAFLEAIKEATNRNPAVLNVVVKDINDTSELRSFVDNNELVKQHLDPNREPSFAGERRTTIESIGRTVGFAQRAGIIASVIFVIISSLIIFNTIRMAIFNRREEIQMMKLIGADSSFIRGPFLVEAIVYGFIAALISTGLGIFALYNLADTFVKSNIGIAIQPTVDFMIGLSPFVLLAMISIGAVIGIISSLLATQRYLKL
ncbi:MAG TPA: permease-like cell division protein FtsX [Candidatus Saccharimonadales bacterium]|nr:permease-like cell division protein FtsX [Candidatus Saccharimonadales bacterium]